MSYFHKVVEFSRAIFTVLPKIFALAPTYRRFAEKNRLSGNTAPNNNIVSGSPGPFNLMFANQFNPYHPNPEKIDDFDIAGSLGHK